MALDASGGWQLAAGANSRGGVIEKADGDGKYVATLDDPAIKAHLEWLKALRWDDDSLLARADMGWGEINAAFGGGELAMYTSGSDVYNALVEGNGVTADWGYGLTAIPTSGEGGALTGGTLAAVRKDSTDAEKDAAVKWIDWWYLSKLQDQDQAVADAKTRAEADPAQAVGTPVLPIFSKELYEENLSWIKDYINVPLDDMTGYTDVMFTQNLVPEAAVATQDLYNQLFPVVQAVITDKDADIDALLTTAEHGRSEGDRRRRADRPAGRGATHAAAGRSGIAPERKSVTTQPTVSGAAGIAGVAAVPSDDVAGEPVRRRTPATHRRPGPAAVA